MELRFVLASTIFSAAIVVISCGNAHGEKHKLLVQVPTHIRQHVHTVYKIIKVPVFIKETKGRQDHHDGHEHEGTHKVEHTGKFEHQHLHKHLHEHQGELKASPLHHHHYHAHEGGVGVDHKHQGTVDHQYHGKVAHGHSGTVDHDHLGFVGHYHGGGVGHQHKGGVGHYHGGLVGHNHEGKVGHKHEGIVGHSHLGIVGHEHDGHVGHGHKGLVGHRHFGDVGHGHDGSVGHGHSGLVAHGHDGHTSHVHAGHIGHNHGGQKEHAHRNSYRDLQPLLSSEEADDQLEEKQALYAAKPIDKPGYYEYTVGSSGQTSTGPHPFSPVSSLGIDEVAASIGKAVGEQNHIHSDEVEDIGSNENDGSAVEYIDARLLQQHPHQYEVFEHPGF
ncbi:UNVERIFIED_CONTAM: hypothetical protein PYX00_001229 [Menopon gallinae]|uniref:Histidine-rich glycoprotein-like n=1 Tax=Menopon gallinae TaxID=328185 RepID=A0AAW2ID83_9NEOP